MKIILAAITYRDKLCLQMSAKNRMRMDPQKLLDYIVNNILDEIKLHAKNE